MRSALSSADIGLWTELWLVTEFVANGSLFDYLSRCSIDVPGICHMASGIAGGLAHLHMEIQGLQVRPSECHNNTKTLRSIHYTASLVLPYTSIAWVDLAIFFFGEKSSCDTFRGTDEIFPTS